MRLSKETRAEIEQMRRQTREKKQHTRLSVLIMLDEGFSYEVIAVSLGIDVDTVGNYKRKYLQKGLQVRLSSESFKLAQAGNHTPFILFGVGLRKLLEVLNEVHLLGNGVGEAMLG